MIASSGTWLFKNWKASLLGISALLLFAYAYFQAIRNVVIVDVISVPKAYEEARLTPSVVALRVSERLEQAEREIETRSRKDSLLQSNNTEVPDIQVPTVNLPLKTVVQLLQRWLHHQPKYIRGEITFPWVDKTNSSSAQSAVLWYHVKDESGLETADKQELQTSNPDQVINAFTEGSLKRVDLSLWAMYLAWKKGDEANASAVAKLILRDSDKAEMLANAYLLLGSIAESNRRYEEAAENYRMALRFDPKSSSAYN